VVYIPIGPYGTCPDCGENTFVESASLLGEVPNKWVAKNYIVRAISRSLVKAHKIVPLTIDDYQKSARTRKPVREKQRFLCPVCKKQSVRFYWIEPVDGALLGPTCKGCVRDSSNKVSDKRGYSIDYPVYTVAANQKILAKAKAVLMIGTSTDDICEMPDDDEVVLL
jgi:transposase-like protein